MQGVGEIQPPSIPDQSLADGGGAVDAQVLDRKGNTTCRLPERIMVVMSGS